jgi:anti-sigma B factor antagonist
MGLEIVRVADPPGFELIGEIDVSNADALDAELQGWSQPYDMTLDLSGLEFIDSSGIRILIDAVVRLRESDRTMILIGPIPSVERVFGILGLAGHGVEIRVAEGAHDRWPG